MTHGSKALTLLVIDDDRSQLELVRSVLASEDVDVHASTTAPNVGDTLSMSTRTQFSSI